MNIRGSLGQHDGAKLVGRFKLWKDLRTHAEITVCGPHAVGIHLAIVRLYKSQR
ncbi:UNVERIFIED_ORG: hypothetical protein L601_002100000370 [Gordonia westfalica J30]